MAGVTLSVARGETLCIVGESGCGKSILARTIMGLLPPQAAVARESAITFKGRDLRSLSGKPLRDMIGRYMAMVFQDPQSSLNPVLKVGHQIMEVLQHHLRLNRQTARRKSIELLYQVGIPMAEERAAQYPHQLSGGMQQRVAIAIALACGPSLLIADEPTTALDATVQADILDLLADLQATQRMAMILISHDLAVVAGRTDTTVVMYAGRVVEQAPTRHLFNTPHMPYTQALMDAMPRLSDAVHTELKSIPGQPPDPFHPLPGCPFAPRCRRVRTRCRDARPPLIGQNDHHFACWFPLQT
jgi:peptide/nickel transport system ATP-binding protein